MSDSAKAVLALWNDVTPDQDAAYNDWHAHEHVPQRLTVPGILWGWRFGHTTPNHGRRYLSLYGLRDASVLDSEPYLALLRDPTPMSRAMRPHLLKLSRWACLLQSFSLHATAPQLAVWTLPASPASGLPERLSQAADAHMQGWLLGQRLQQVQALPWLQTRQESVMEEANHQTLVCAGFDAALPPGGDLLDGSTVYDRLPVG